MRGRGDLWLNHRNGRTQADLYLPLSAGSPKFSWVNPTGGHTGRGPGWSEERVNTEVVAAWLAGQMK